MGVYPSKDIVRQAGDACVADDARVSGDACVAGNAQTAGNARAEVTTQTTDDTQTACAGDVAAQLPCAARIEYVVPESPADDAGFEAGCYLTHVDGHPLRDIIDWRWHSSGYVVVLGYVDLDGDVGTVELERDEGEDWGFEFDGVIFDRIKLCRNACTFCFMRQLPDDMRSSLSLRDDDFRLSFLSGTFVTLTNLSPADEARIIEQRISPLRVSLHASNEQVRRRMIGKHAAHGIAVLDRLLAAGIEVHAQIVLVPGDNDGDVLRETLLWAYKRPGIVGVGIVPLGFTKHQTCFAESFNDEASARGVVEVIHPFQERALAERQTPWVFAADEFYSNAFGDELLDNLPPTSHYGDFSMFEDGIGIIRSYVDDWQRAEASGAMLRCAEVLHSQGIVARYVVGEAMQPFLNQLVAKSPVAGVFEPLTVRNEYFGGNVDVTGLLCGCDVSRAVAHATGNLFALPQVMFNDDSMTLDDMTLQDMENAAGKPMAVVSCNASDFMREIADLAGRM
nr:DUF512 domain-containing protein [Adlercreutzia sp. ZJ141]